MRPRRGPQRRRPAAEQQKEEEKVRLAISRLFSICRCGLCCCSCRPSRCCSRPRARSSRARSHLSLQLVSILDRVCVLRFAPCCRCRSAEPRQFSPHTTSAGTSLLFHGTSTPAPWLRAAAAISCCGEPLSLRADAVSAILLLFELSLVAYILHGQRRAGRAVGATRPFALFGSGEPGQRWSQHRCVARGGASRERSSCGSCGVQSQGQSMPRSGLDLILASR